MKVVFDPSSGAQLSLDDDDRVRYINHFENFPQPSERGAVMAAITYLREMSELLKLPEVYLAYAHQRVSYLDPREEGVEYRVSEEKQYLDSTTVGFAQTQLNTPVWGAGLTVTVKHGSNQIVGCTDTSLEGVEAALPDEAIIEKYRELIQLAEVERVGREAGQNGARGSAKTTTFLREIVDSDRLQRSQREARLDHLIRGRFFVYRYDPEARLPRNHEQSAIETAAKGKQEYLNLTEIDHRPVLPLRPVDDRIEPGRDYVVAEITFELATTPYGHVTWLALVELETQSVLYLRALAAGVSGMIFKVDPITGTGNAANTADQSNAVLNPFRTSLPLPDTDAPVAGVQSLRGAFANVTNVEDPNIAAPTEPVPTAFDFDVRTDNFAAVNAYYHVDRFFAIVADLGFPAATYFDQTTFPIAVDHRDLGTTINAHCIGNGMGGIGHVGYALNDLTDTTHPVGRACDSRVHWHELGGHGTLYEHVNSANFGFSHSAGDGLSAILHDPDSKAPDRFRYAPWNPTNLRRFDRTVAAGWGWGGPNDDTGYGSEEILATTHFRIYRSIGGDSSDVNRRKFASRMTMYLILRAISTLTPATNPGNALGFANALMVVDLLDWTTEGLSGGAYNKVIRWSYEKQGLYSGQPPAVDVYIEDGRGGEYPFEAVHWNNTSIWNRNAADGGITHDPPIEGVPNYAYVKVKNRGTQTAHNVKVRGYHSKPSAGVSWPLDLQPFTTAELVVGDLAGNNGAEQIVGPFEWTPVVNAYGHDCMFMVVSADGDPSNTGNFGPGDTIADWRLVPNDNNIGQRNVVFAPGGGGMEGLLAGLDGVSFWVGNPNKRATTIDLSAHLPRLLTGKGWHVSFRDVHEGGFRVRPGEQREVVIDLRPGEDFDTLEVERSKERDIVVSVYSDNMLIGGMTYVLDPALERPSHAAGGPGRHGHLLRHCRAKAQDLLECLDVAPDRQVERVDVKSVTIDIELRE